jgi:hypothetical protein
MSLPPARVVTKGRVDVLAPAPRHIPVRLWLGLVFGHPLTQFGLIWIAGCLGALLSHHDLESRYTFDRTATAHVDRVVEITDDDDNITGYRVYYRFNDESGSAHSDYGFADQSPLRAEIEVRYDHEHPRASKPVTFRSRFLHPSDLLYVLIAGGIGAAFLAWPAIRARRALRLLRYGRETRGKLIHKEVIESSEGDTTKLTFEYEAEGAKHQLLVRPEYAGRLEDDEAEPMMYDIANPARAVMIDDLPGKPIIVDGELRARSGWWFVFALVVPAVIVTEVVRIVSSFL